jgi:YidC/Oxa1 family membrane protein insertase
MFDLFKWIAGALSWFYELWPSYGGAIVLLTLAIMIVLTPLTLKGTRSMLAMQRLQPELKQLQQKYKDDRQKLNEEMLKFYKENNINPVSGCLPLLVQMPIFLVLYRVLSGLTHRADFGTDFGSASGLAIADPSAVFTQFGHFDPDYLNESSDLYQSLSQTNEMTSFGLNLADSAQQALADGIGHAVPYLVLVLMVVATSYIQQKQVSGRSQAQVNPQQQMLLKIFPLFFAFISFTLPAGIVLYFLASNAYRIGQQAWITRTMYGDRASAAKPPVPRKGLLATARSMLPSRESLPDFGVMRGTKPASKAGTIDTKATETSAEASASSKVVAGKRGPTGGNGAAKKRAAPAKRRAPAPANRSRSKKKRK